MLIVCFWKKKEKIKVEEKRGRKRKGRRRKRKEYRIKQICVTKRDKGEGARGGLKGGNVELRPNLSDPSGKPR